MPEPVQRAAKDTSPGRTLLIFLDDWHMNVLSYFIGAILFVLGYSAYSSAEQQSLLGRWVGTISMMGTESSFQVDFTLGPQPSWSSKPPQQILKGTIDSPRHQLKGAELTHLRFDSSKVHFELPFPIFALFDGDFKNDKISGTYQEGKSRGSFSLIRIHKPQKRSNGKIAWEASHSERVLVERHRRGRGQGTWDRARETVTGVPFSRDSGDCPPSRQSP